MKKLLKRSLCLMMATIMVMSIAMASKVEAKAAGIDYSSVFNASYYAARYADLRQAFGTDAKALLNHFLTVGMKEGRQGSEEFNVIAYRNRYLDLYNAYGENLKMYYIHYVRVGKAEGRSGRVDGVRPVVNTPATTAAKPVAPKPAAVAPAKPATTPANVTPVNFEVPKNAIPCWNGYILQDVGPAVMSWINNERDTAKVCGLTWSQSIANNGTQRAVELSMSFSSGRPDGTPWQTAYGNGEGPIKEMIIKMDGVMTSASLENAIKNNTDRMRYITTSNFRKCGISVYTENGKSYAVLAFTQAPKED